MIGLERVDTKSEMSFFSDNNNQLVTKLIKGNRMTYFLSVSRTFSGAH